MTNDTIIEAMKEWDYIEVDKALDKARADTTRKFAEWCKKNNIQCRKKVDGEWIQFSVSEIVADFEKEQKNEH